MSTQSQTICWITPDYFLNIDAQIVPHLAADFDVNWILINTHNTRRTANGLHLGSFKPTEYNLRYRQRDPRIVAQYVAILLDIRRMRHDLVYTSFHGLPYFLPILSGFVDPERVIYAVHNVRTPKGAVNERAMRLYHGCMFKVLKRFHVFSEYQLQTIASLLPHKRHYYAPFPLMDHGRSDVIPRSDVVRFLFFGYIRAYKRLDLLIRAFQNLRRLGISNIELVIAGDCDNWEYYSQIIGDTPGIEARIGVVRNEDIPDLVASCHYLVLPYQDTAQSAVLTLAYEYGKPVIASDIEGFRHAVDDARTGFFFRSESESSLTAVMLDVLEKHRSRYEALTHHIQTHVRRECAIEQVWEKYKHFLVDALSDLRVGRNSSSASKAAAGIARGASR